MADKHATKAITVQTLAEEAGRWFETFKRDASGDAEFWRTKDGHPAWVKDMCMDAHESGSMLPDDWRYEFIYGALNALDSNDDPDDITLDSDPYTFDLLRWLASDLSRTSYCDAAIDDGLWESTTRGGDNGGTIRLIAIGQIMEKEEVLRAVRAFLESRAEELESEREEAEAAAASAEDEAAQPSGDEYELQ